ncbi:type II secretion system protein GspD [Citrobacter meridianamericanus]|uniref:type II secretion system protein GspD n=1 Tax=Citrobacter meridianamericanus TaxID=2894201 RepID=UPI00351D9EE7
MLRHHYLNEVNIMRLLSFPLFCLCSPVFAAGTDFEVNAMKFPEAVSVIWNQVLKRPFMLSPELTQDARMLTLHIHPDNDERDFILRYLENMNVKVTQKKGVDYLYSFKPVITPQRFYTYTYIPRFRDVPYLAQALGTSFTQNISNAGADSLQVSSEQPFMSTSGDTFVYRGTKRNIDQIEKLLEEIDVRAEQVLVSAFVFEVQTNEKNGSGLVLASKLLNDRFSIGIGSKQGYSNFIQFNGPSFDALYELFRTDNRFSLVSSPRLRVVSGQESAFSVGASVPTVGSLTYENGTPVQSIVYRNTGVDFKVRPIITRDLVSMKIDQQLSDYAETTTGVNNSPTFTTRQIVTNVNMKDGDIIVLSGLAENKDGEQNTGLSFLPKSWSTKSDQKQSTDLLIVIQAKKV